MKATIKIYKNDGANDFGFPVKLIISHNRKTRRKKIGYANLDDWDQTSQLPLPSHDDFEDLYTTILEIRKKAVSGEFSRIDDFSLAFGFLLDRKEKKIVDFYEWSAVRVRYMYDHDRIGNAEAYEHTIVELKRLSPALSFEEITPLFIQQFKDLKKLSKIKNTTIRKYIGEFRAIYNSAVKAGITEDKKPFADCFSDIPVRRRRAKNWYLDKESIDDIEKMELVHPSFQRALDLSLLQFYLCGANLVDVYYLKKENIYKGRVFLERRKLGDKAYEFDVLLSDKAKRIIEKYKDKDPKKEYVFPWPKSYLSYKTFRNNQNRSLKKLQVRLNIELVPKNGNFTTNVMRHTFATLGKFARVEEDLLRELMGHERNDVDTIYKDKYPEADRDAAQLKIIELKD